MDVIILPDRDRAVAFVARLVEERLRAKPDLVLGLAAGRTMEGIYDRLAASGVSFAACHAFALDEYLGLGPDHPSSFAHYMHTHLYSKIDIDPEKTYIPDGAAADPDAAAIEYENQIAAAGGIDLQLLGIGANGHIAFNEPLSALQSRTRTVTLTQETRAQNAGMFGGDARAVPPRALTMGVGTILDGRELVLVALGSGKAEILARAIEGPLTASVSASALQIHPNCKVVLDGEAAAHLAGREHYLEAFARDPAWDDYR